MSSTAFGKRIDELIYALSPKWGARRLASRRLHELTQLRLQRLSTMWDTETDVRVRGHRWLTSNLSIDSLLKWNITDLQERMTSLYRKSIIAHAAIEGRVANEVGVGIVPQSRVRAFNDDRNAEIKTAIEDMLVRWSDDGVDKSRKQSLSSFERQVVRTYATYGEVFVHFSSAPFDGPISLALEVVAPERVETPPELEGDDSIRMGVKYSESGIIQGYYVRTKHPGDDEPEFAYDFIPRFHERIEGHPRQVRMAHVFEPLFAEQSRGIPWLVAAMNRLKDMDDIFEAELIAKQIESCFGLIFKGGKQSTSPMDMAEVNSESELDSSNRRLEEFLPGTIHYAEEGEEVNVVDPMRPGATFAPLVELSLRSIASAANYPYELLAKNFFRTTFSSGRLAVLDGRIGFRMRSQVIVEQLLRPIYSRAVYLGVFEGDLDRVVDLLDYLDQPYAYDRHKWQGQGDPHIDPDKERRAQALAKNERLSTETELAAEDGRDWEEQEQQRHQEDVIKLRNEIKLRAMRKEMEEAAGLVSEDEPEAEEQDSAETEQNTASQGE